MIIILCEANLGGNGHSLGGFWKADVSLLDELGGDDCVDLDWLDVVEAVESSSDLGLGGLDINPEGHGVRVLELASGLIRSDWTTDDLVVVALERDWLDGLMLVSWAFWNWSSLAGVELVEVTGLGDLLLLTLGKSLCSSLCFGGHDRGRPKPF